MPRAIVLAADLEAGSQRGVAALKSRPLHDLIHGCGS
jgi:hypothetical protein